MVVETGGQRLEGADALAALALLALGRDGLGAGSATAARTVLFGRLFALFCIFHFFNYALEYARSPPRWDQAAVLASGVALLLHPGSARALCAASTVAPVASNHTMVRSALLIGYWAAFAAAMARGRDARAVFETFAPSGRATLLVMYAFGIFHKLNTDFLDPATSCAVALWRAIPAPLSWADCPLVEHAAIGATFVAEGGSMAALIARRTRHAGVVAGIALHATIAASGYAMYVSFSTLAIALHALFVSEAAAQRIAASAPVRALAAPAAGAPAPPPGRPIALAVAALFAANCALPYLGGKTAQTISMFSNLHLEGGRSNHLVLTRPPGPLGYLDDVAGVHDGGGDAVLERHSANGVGTVYHDLLARLVANPALVVTYTRDGTRREAVGWAAQAADAHHLAHPAWARRWFHFEPVSLAPRRHCRFGAPR